MLTLVTLLPSLLLAAGAASQHIGLDIPEVDRAVSAALSKFANYTASHTPTATANSSTAASTGASKVDAVAVAAATVSDPAYWYADLTHQGIAAFNADPSTYVVYRNVKDYGAAGKCHFLSHSSSETLTTCCCQVI